MTNDELYRLIGEIQNECTHNHPQARIGIPRIDKQYRELLQGTHTSGDFSSPLDELSHSVETIDDDREDAQCFYELVVQLITHYANNANPARPPKALKRAFDVVKQHFRAYGDLTVEQLVHRPVAGADDNQAELPSEEVMQANELELFKQQTLNCLEILQQLCADPDLLQTYGQRPTHLLDSPPTVDLDRHPQRISEYVTLICELGTGVVVVKRCWQQVATQYRGRNEITGPINHFIAAFIKLYLGRLKQDLARLIDKGEALVDHAFSCVEQTATAVKRQMRQWSLRLHPDKMAQHLGTLTDGNIELREMTETIVPLIGDVFATLLQAKQQSDTYYEAYNTADTVTERARSYLVLANQWAISVKCESEADFQRVEDIGVREHARAKDETGRLDSQRRCAKQGLVLLREACRLLDKHSVNTGRLNVRQIMLRRLLAEACFLARSFAEAQLFVFTTEVFIKKLTEDIGDIPGLRKEVEAFNHLKNRIIGDSDNSTTTQPTNDATSSVGVLVCHEDSRQLSTIVANNRARANIRRAATDVLASQAIVTADKDNVCSSGVREDIIFKAKENRASREQQAEVEKKKERVFKASGIASLTGGAASMFGAGAAVATGWTASAMAAGPAGLIVFGCGFALYRAAIFFKGQEKLHKAGAEAILKSIDIREKLNAITNGAVTLFQHGHYIESLQQFAVNYGDEHPLLEDLIYEPPDQVTFTINVGRVVSRLLALDVPPDGVAYLLTLIAEAIVKVTPKLEEQERLGLYLQAIKICEHITGEKTGKETARQLSEAAEEMDREINNGSVDAPGTSKAFQTGSRNMPIAANLEEMRFIAELNRFIIKAVGLGHYAGDTEEDRKAVQEVVHGLKRRMEQGYGSQGYLDVEERLYAVEDLLLALGYPINLLEAALGATDMPVPCENVASVQTLTFENTTDYATPTTPEDMVPLGESVEPLPLLHALTGGSVTVSEAGLREKITKLPPFLFRHKTMADEMVPRLARHKLLRHVGLLERRYLPLLSVLLGVQFDVYEQSDDRRRYRHLPENQQPKVPEGCNYPIIGLVFPTGVWQRAPSHAFSAAMVRDIRPLSMAIMQAEQLDKQAEAYIKRAQHYLSIAKASKLGVMASLFYFKSAQTDFRLADRLFIQLMERGVPLTAEASKLAVQSIIGIVTCQLARGRLRSANKVLSDGASMFARRSEPVLRSFRNHPEYLYLYALILRKSHQYETAEGAIRNAIFKAEQQGLPVLPRFKREQAVIHALRHGTRATAPDEGHRYRSDERAWACGLSIDGGGIRGTFPATILKCFEKDTQKPISACYTVLGGTSTGGIVALALSLPKPLTQGGYSTHEPLLTAGDVVNLYTSTTNRRNIFYPRTRRWYDLLPGGGQIANALFIAKYDSRGRQAVIDSLAGKTTLNHLLTSVVVPAFSHDNPYVTKFFRKGDKMRNGQSYRVADVAMATSAAPTYFDAHTIQFAEGDDYVKEVFWDGGLQVNNPAVEVMNEVRKQAGSNKKIHLWSIGTGDHAEHNLAPSRFAGSLFFATRNLPESLRAQQNNADEELRRTPDIDYVRTQFLMDNPIELDDISADAQDFLENAALQKVEEMAAEGEWQRMVERFAPTP